MPEFDGSAWAALSTATISDALDRLQIEGQCKGLTPISSKTCSVIAGEAFTVSMASAGDSGGSVGDYIDKVPPGAIVVIDNQGRTDVTVWGELLTTAALGREVAGTVIDGCCRDSAISNRLGYPIFCRGSFMRTGKGRVRMKGCQVPVTLGRLGGVRVGPGDVVVADADGVLVVPRMAAGDILAAALEIERVETEIRRAIQAGSSLEAARTTFGYHELQSARKIT